MSLGPLPIVKNFKIFVSCQIMLNTGLRKMGGSQSLRFLVTGGSGFIGRRLVDHLVTQGQSVVVLSRQPSLQLGGAQVISSLTQIAGEPMDVIINLAGATINQRWTDAVKAELIQSRVQTTADLVQWMRGLSEPPSLLISASAIGFYGSSSDQPITESSEGRPEFTNTLCTRWEAEAQKARDLGVRTCITRLGVVLGSQGGALREMLPAFKLGAGGRLGTGTQWFSWVHLDDVLGVFDFLVAQGEAEGVYNLTAPFPVTNLELTQALGSTLNRPTFFRVPECMVRLLFGEMGEALLLKGGPVEPARLLEAGYTFEFPRIQTALAHLLQA